MDEFMHYGVAAGVQAVTDSGIDFSKTDPEQCGAVCGAGIGGLWTIEQDYEEYLKAKIRARSRRSSCPPSSST